MAEYGLLGNDPKSLIHLRNAQATTKSARSLLCRSLNNVAWAGQGRLTFFSRKISSILITLQMMFRRDPPLRIEKNGKRRDLLHVGVAMAPKTRHRDPG